MPGRYGIELDEPSASHCDCCGALMVRLTRFVYRDGDAFAVYFATYSNTHADHEIAMLVSLGAWAEDSDPAARAAFYCRVRATNDSYEVMLGNAADSVWREAESIGAKLSREEALRHPWKSAAFEVLDEAFARDPSLGRFLQRVQCGDPSVPLETSFGMPDDVFALGEERKVRADIGRSFVSLDGARFFVRSLLPVPVESYGTWCVGLWVEVSKTDYDRVQQAQDDPDEYPSLRLPGALANDVGAELGLPVAPGTKVDLHVPDPDAPPKVAASGELTALLSKPWSKADFEDNAVARGFL